MLSDTKYMEQLDQECLKAHDAFSAISDHTEKRNLISPCKDCKMTTAGLEREYFRDLGLDIEIIYQREVEFGSKALLYSYTDQMLCVVYYHERSDRYHYWGFPESDISAALKQYMTNY